VDAAIVPTRNEVLWLLKPRYVEDLSILPGLGPSRFEISIGFAKNSNDLAVISTRKLEGHSGLERVAIYLPVNHGSEG
jgi:hypothetical protein